MMTGMTMKMMMTKMMTMKMMVMIIMLTPDDALLPVIAVVLLGFR